MPRIAPTLAGAVAAVLAIVLIRNAADGTLAKWAAAKFFNRGGDSDRNTGSFGNRLFEAITSKDQGNLGKSGLGTTSSAALPNVTATGLTSMDKILATIRSLESGGNYTARAQGSDASGAYQFIAGTWGGFGGYSQAYLAPAPVQDAKATAYVQSILTANNNNLLAVPVTWYIGHVPAPGSPEWDQVPAAWAGNTLTPRQYAERWLQAFQGLARAA